MNTVLMAVTPFLSLAFYLVITHPLKCTVAMIYLAKGILEYRETGNLKLACCDWLCAGATLAE